MKKYALIACSSRKLQVSDIQARSLYQGTAFRYAVLYAEKYFDGFFILSAKYGFLKPDDLISNYNVCMKDLSRAKRREWTEIVTSELRNTIEKGTEITFLAGKDYWEYVVPLLKNDYKICLPLAKLRQGEQVQWMKEQAGHIK